MLALVLISGFIKDVMRQFSLNVITFVAQVRINPYLLTRFAFKAFMACSFSPGDYVPLLCDHPRHHPVL